jgi:hypothetical protein
MSILEVILAVAAGEALVLAATVMALVNILNGRNPWAR